MTLCGSQNRSFQNQAKIPAILLCPLLGRGSRAPPSSLQRRAPAGDARWAGPEPVRPLLPPVAASSAAAALPGSRLAPLLSSLWPRWERGRLACHVAAWPHALIGWCSRQTARHTRPARPRPEGCGPRSGSGPAPGAPPAPLSQPGVGSHTVGPPAPAPLRFALSRPLPVRREAKWRLAGAGLPARALH